MRLSPPPSWSSTPISRRSALAGALGLGAAAGLSLAGCAPSGSGSQKDIVVAIVSNPQMTDAISLQQDFRDKFPNINPRFVSLPENEARAKITTSVATQGGEFDVVMISNYETAQWAKNGWITNLQPFAEGTAGYDPDDFIPSVRAALSFEDNLYSVPFYGESSFVAYRKDLFEQAGLVMPKAPSWEDIRSFAQTLDGSQENFTGIVLRGLAGWGEVMAPLDTVINTYGGRWFDMDWNAQLVSAEVTEAVNAYVKLLQDFGQPGAATSGYGDCITRFTQGQTAMWYDATAMVSSVEDPNGSLVAGKVGYAPAPTNKTDAAGWLYSWSLAIPATSQVKDEAWSFIQWMTNKEYMRLVGEEIAWERVPPGSRQSTYEIPEYREVSQAYAEPTLNAMQNATQENTMTEPVPYEGIQFVAIPEFQDLGTRVAQQISASIAGQTSIDDALAQSQRYAQTVGASYQREGQN